MQIMVAGIEDIAKVKDTAANCLMLLTRVGEYGGGEALDEKRVFTCNACMKEFSSFQALGGHRASHTKPIQSADRSLLGSLKKMKTATSHPCPICGVEFPLGQALGGHMRKHRNEKENVSDALLTRSFFPETTTVTTLKNLGSGKRVECLDVDLDSELESTINTKLELGLGSTVT